MLRKLLIIMVAANLNAASSATAIFNISASNTNNRLKHLESLFTSNGWQEYFSALKSSGTLLALNKHGLNLSADLIETAPKTVIKLTYNFPKYSYQQIVELNITRNNDKIDHLSTKVIKQSELAIKYPACKLSFASQVTLR